MAGIDDLFSDPNAGAYVRKETRVGPPLEYVGEKLAGAVEAAHQMYRAVDEAGAPRGDPLRASAYETFRYALTAFLALYNMLGLLANQLKIDELLALDVRSFTEWLDDLAQEGSVSG